MTNSNPSTKPELKDYLNQDKLKVTCSTLSPEAIFEFVTMKITAYEADLKTYYMDKNINESATLSKEDIELNNNLRALGF